MKIAIVGSGISGLSAALILSSKFEVHLFESESRLGGHAHTVFMNSQAHSDRVAVDTGFLVYNTLTYPHLTRFLEYLGVQTVESDMTLSIQAPNGLEWGGADLSTVFAQKRNLFRPMFWKMLADILHFNKNAEKNLILSREQRWTLDDLLREKKYGDAFKTLYILPMTGAIWSMSYAHALQFPAETFLTFCINHHLLQVNNRPIWRTIKNGSINYVNRVRERLKHVHYSSEVTSIRRSNNKLIVSTKAADIEFDKVILATHAPTSRKMIQIDFPDLASELSDMEVTANKVELHEDESIMPKSKTCWSAWNVQARQNINDSADICLTYYINKLQPLVCPENYFVTLNCHNSLKKVHRAFQYDHPKFNFSAIATQQRLPTIQGRHGIFFAGAWTRYGFHEDGILSAVNVARQLGVEPPWI